MIDSYKGALIHGAGHSERGINDGELETLGLLDGEDNFHSKVLLDYAKEKYPDVGIFNKLTIRHQPEVIAYFLTRLGDIVFLNITRYDEKSLSRYGRSGILLMCDNPTDKQKETLKEFSRSISNFNVEIGYDLSIDQGYLDSKCIQMLDNESPEELVNTYLNNVSSIVNK